MEDKFNDLGVDALLGSQVMQTLGAHQQDLQNAVTFEKIKGIIQYLKPMSPETRQFFVSEVLVGKNVNRIDHLHNYIQVHKKYELRKMEMDELKKELDFYK